MENNHEFYRFTWEHDDLIFPSLGEFSSCGWFCCRATERSKGEGANALGSDGAGKLPPNKKKEEFGQVFALGVKDLNFIIIGFIMP